MTLLKTTAALGLASTLLLSACVSTTPVDDRTRTQQGAIAGALAGAAIGAATDDGRDDKLKRAVVGAAVGGAVGAAIGDQLDRQAQELRNSLDSRIDVTNTGDRIVVNAPESILFATDSAAVRAPGQIRTIGQNLLQFPNSRVQVIGHTDNTGSAAYNQDLSERRARSVAGILYEAGVSPARVQTIGRGESSPIASNQTAEGRQANRRVEIVIIPNG
ncbi:OmpA family protein [Jannaschia sp. W003]|uniref:OmpA family protein n=1 Tax=Jannaschia sp. W003 TaxID=2867012 RepID=UPI0021A90237|nr:OmpA family protein [Jannaschia sp. W003]UWQ22277.1 OmpA family protein [Jannaschia sp. W003]